MLQYAKYCLFCNCRIRTHMCQRWSSRTDGTAAAPGSSPCCLMPLGNKTAVAVGYQHFIQAYFSHSFAFLCEFFLTTGFELGVSSRIGQKGRRLLRPKSQKKFLHTHYCFLADWNLTGKSHTLVCILLCVLWVFKEFSNLVKFVL